MSKSNLLLNVTNGLWLIEPSAVHAFQPIVRQLIERDAELLSRDVKDPACFLVRADGSLDLSPETGMETTGEARGSVAVVSITGAIMKYDNCGDAGTQSLGRLVQSLDANPNIAAIVFKMDSPGGTVAGTEDFAKIISDCKVPTLAYSDGLICSACYWFASQCNEIYCGNKTDQIGSIGTMCSFADVQPMWEKEGVKFHEIYADASSDKNKDYNEARKGNYDLLKQHLNEVNEVFLSAVKGGRGEKLNQKETLSGKVFMAEEAVEMGLSDGMKSFDEVIARAFELAQDQQETNNLTINNYQTTMKVKSKFGAVLSALGSVFPGFKADDTITEEHIEELNNQLTIRQASIDDLTEKLSTANASVEKLTNDLSAEKAAFETFKKGNPGATNSLKSGNDDLGAIQPTYNKTSVDLEREAAAANKKMLDEAYGIVTKG